jgi:hypothetical protein
MHVLIGILLFCCSTSIYGQINKGRKLVDAGDYEAALAAFENDIEKTTSKPISLYEIARIYYSHQYKEQDLDKAYLFVNRALREFEALSSADKRKVQNKDVNQPELKKLQQDIVRKALKLYQKENTIEGFEHFIDYYNTANKQQLEQAYRVRNQLIFEQAEKEHTFAKYKWVWDTYKQNMERYNPTAIKKVERYLLESFIEEKGWAMYPSFEALYPENVYVRSRDAAYDFLKIRRSTELHKFQDFLTSYPKSPFTKFAKDRLLELILETNQLEAYDAFVRAYPKHKNIDQLWKRFYDLYTPNKKKTAILRFAKAYPNFPFKTQIKQDLITAQAKLEQPLFEQFVRTKDIHQGIHFVQQFPQSTYIPRMEEAFYQAIQKKPLLRGSGYFIQQYPNSVHYDAVLELYYKEYVKDGELGTLNQFMMEHPEYKNLAQQEKDLKIAEQGAQLDISQMPTHNNQALYEAYIKAAAPKERAFVTLQRLLEPAIRQKKWQKAQEILVQFESYFESDRHQLAKIQQLKSILTAPNSTSQVLPATINDSQTERIVAVRDQSIIFGRERILYTSTNQNGQWTAPILMPIINEGIRGDFWTLSTDNQQIAYSQMGDLYHRELQEGRWSDPTKLPKTVNSPEQELDVHLTADGRALLYSSNSDQVLDWRTAIVTNDFHGTGHHNSDLFVVLKNTEGKWHKVINLGDQINTPFAECAPFMHSDGVTLYFCSEGHGGLGGLDLYYTRRLDDSWQNWSTPVNLGTAINSPDHERAAAVSDDANHLYFTRQNEEGSQIFYAPLSQNK